MDKWSQKWLEKHKNEIMQEFAVALSKRTTRTSIFLMCIEIVAFMIIMAISSFLK